MTIKEIAKLAGVSVATVSRVINNNGPVKEETRQLVVKVVKQYNYDTGTSKRRQINSKIVGIIVPTISNQFYTQVISGIEEALNRNGYSALFVSGANGDVRKYKKYLRMFMQEGVAGIISSAFNGQEIAVDVPLVIFDSANIDDNIVRVVSDNKTGGKWCSDLLSNSAKNILVQHLPLRYPTVRERIDALIAELEYKRLNYTLQEFEGVNLPKYETMVLPKVDFEKYDAIIAPSDLYALALLRQALHRGFKVPEDFQLVGYDNNPFATFSTPSLSTIDQQPFEIGQETASRLLQLIQGKSETKNSVISVRAIKRESTL